MRFSMKLKILGAYSACALFCSSVVAMDLNANILRIERQQPSKRRVQSVNWNAQQGNEINNLRGENGNLRNQVTQQGNEINNLRGENGNLRNQVTQQGNEINNLRGENGNLRNQVTQQGNEINNLRGENGNLRNSINTARHNIQGVQGVNQGADLNQEVQNLIDIYNNQQNQLNGANQQNAILQKLNNVLRSKIEQRDAKISDLKKESRVMDIAQKELKELKERKDTLTKEISEIQKNIEDIERIMAEMRERKDKKVADGHYTTSEESINKYQTLESKKCGKEKERSSKGSELLKVCERIKILSILLQLEGKNNFEKFNDASIKIMKLQGEVQRLKQDSENQSNELQGQMQTNLELKYQIEANQGKISELEEQNNTAKQDIEKLKNQLKVTDDQNADLENQIKGKDEELSKLKVELEDQRKATDAINIQNAESKKLLDEANNKNAELENQINGLQDQIGANQGKISELERELNKNKDEKVSELEKQNYELMEIIMNFRKKSDRDWSEGIIGNGELLSKIDELIRKDDENEAG